MCLLICLDIWQEVTRGARSGQGFNMGKQKVIEALLLNIVLFVDCVDRLDWRVAFDHTFVTPRTPLFVKHALGTNTYCAVFKHRNFLSWHWQCVFAITDGFLALNVSYINWKDSFGAHQDLIETIILVLW